LIENAILIAGPTASGKSALAIELAQREKGVIVNADSMQVYSVLKVITARPGAEERAMAPHLLYGHVDPRDAYSTGDWLRDVRHLAENGDLAGRRAIFVGGTGLYFRALLGGLSAMPAIPTAIREDLRRHLSGVGPQGLHALLSQRDPDAAARIGTSDGQRILRALEVLETSGRSILFWQGKSGEPMVDSSTAWKIVVEPEREMLRKRIEERFDRMLDAGALEEVKRLTALALDPSRPAAKAIGVRELQDFLSGRTSIDEAVKRAKAASRQYAKRQMTWFRHQLGPDWQRKKPFPEP
jgi:tRNA dimethylallyltransferase